MDSKGYYSTRKIICPCTETARKCKRPCIAVLCFFRQRTQKVRIFILYLVVCPCTLYCPKTMRCTLVESWCTCFLPASSCTSVKSRCVYAMFNSDTHRFCRLCRRRRKGVFVSFSTWRYRFVCHFRNRVFGISCSIYSFSCFVYGRRGGVGPPRPDAAPKYTMY